MDQQIASYENKKKDISRYLKHLNHECRSYFGPMNKYVPPVPDPYVYANATAYKRNVLGKMDERQHIKKRCKFLGKVSSVKDPQSRYYTNVTREAECKGVKGTWDASAVNRSNKFGVGVCWVTPQDKVCGEQVDPKFLRPYNSKFKDLTSQRLGQSAKCNQTPGCKWQQQSQYTWDCVKGKAREVTGPVMEPPKDMPEKEGLEEFIFRWYTSEDAPETTELLGTGNRCKGTIMDENKRPEKPGVSEYIDYRVLDPHNANDVPFLKVLLNDKGFAKYAADWDELKRIGPLSFNEHYKGNSFLDNFYNRMDHQQLMDDKPLEEIKDAPKVGMFPSVPQSIVNMVMKHVAMTNGEKRGMLAWHSTGSGKTCTATGVIDAFWDTDRPIIFASSIDAIASNPDFKFHECALNLYPRFQQGEFKGHTKAESMALIAAAFKRRNVRFLSFAKLSNRVVKAQEYKKLNKVTKGTKGAKVTKVTKVTKLDKSGGDTPVDDTLKHNKDILNTEAYVDLDNAVLIIDEVHNLFRPLANQKKEHERLEKELLDPRKHPNMKVVILTATPGDNIPDVVKLLNIIRDPKQPEIKLNDITNAEEVAAFKESIRGMISYFDMSNDFTKFPVVHDKQEFIRAPMSDTQFNKYMEAYKAIKHDQQDYDALARNNRLSRYWEGARKYSNMLFNFDKDMALSDFSAKMPKLLENIQSHPQEKQYVYSAFYTKMGYGGQGIVAIAKEMEKLGYKKLTVAEAKKLNAANKLPPKGKRYILAITTEIGEAGVKPPRAAKGDNGEPKVRRTPLHELLHIYNHPENRYGEYVHVMLASQGFNEGIDLKAVRHIHFFEPLVTMASDKQTLGRAARYCSHEELDKDKGEWTVDIHRYMSDKPALTAKMDTLEVQNKLEMEQRALRTRIDSEESLRDELRSQKALVKDMMKNNMDASRVKQQIETLEKYVKNISEDKKLLKEKEKQLHALQNPSRKKNTIDPSTIENIENLVFKESRERMKELLTIYQCMKEAAVDCKVLSKFHSSTGHKVVCNW